ncbi:MAG: DsbA family protein [Acidimicrobiales bacterium]
MTTSFGVTYDYRCPFARNAHEHLLTALRAGADWDVDFIPFSLSQLHVEEGNPPIWEDQSRSSDLLALEASLVVAERFPDRFLDVHEALFAARHDHARDLRDPDVIVDVLGSNGVDPKEVSALLEDGSIRKEVRRRHEACVTSHRVFGVPTFITGDKAAFVRILNRPQGDSAMATQTIERILDLVADHPEINEVKHTSVPL